MYKNITESRFLPFLSLIISVLCLSVSPLFVRWADAPGIVTSFYRMLIGSLILAAFLPWIKQKSKNSSFRNLPRAVILLPVLCGVFTALDHTFWTMAIERTNIANSTLLNYIATLWVALFAILVLKEKYHWVIWVGLFVVLGGVAVVLGIQNIQLSSFSLGGEGLAILSSFFYAGYFIATQKSRGFFSAYSQLLLSMVFGSITLAAIILARGFSFWDYNGITFLMFFLAALISQLVGYYSMIYALGSIRASIVTPFMVLQPVATALLAIPLAQETLYYSQIGGGLLVILGIYLINRSKLD
ncbi:MAG: DMT family transporter [Anaerolineales bacterium]|nr:DMT family transporter [Anaerolineales bacterium]